MNNNCFAGRLACQENSIPRETLTEKREAIEALGFSAIEDDEAVLIGELSELGAHAASLLAAEGRPAHGHMADSNRSEPGPGHTEFAGIECTLAEIEFDGNVAFECLLPEGEPLRRLEDSTRYLVELGT